MKRLSLFATILVWLYNHSLGLAQEMAADSTARIMPPAFSESVIPSLFKLGLALLVIIVLIYLSVLMLKKMSSTRLGKSGNAGSIEVVDRHFLAPKKQLCLVKVSKRYFLVGATEQAINLLADVSDQDLEQDRKVAQPRGEAPGFSFKKILTDVRNNFSILSRQAENTQKS